MIVGNLYLSLLLNYIIFLGLHRIDYENKCMLSVWVTYYMGSFSKSNDCLNQGTKQRIHHFFNVVLCRTLSQKCTSLNHRIRLHRPTSTACIKVNTRHFWHVIGASSLFRGCQYPQIQQCSDHYHWGRNDAPKACKLSYEHIISWHDMKCNGAIPTGFNTYSLNTEDMLMPGNFHPRDKAFGRIAFRDDMRSYRYWNLHRSLHKWYI